MSDSGTWYVLAGIFLVSSLGTNTLILMTLGLNCFSNRMVLLSATASAFFIGAAAWAFGRGLAPDALGADVFGFVALVVAGFTWVGLLAFALGARGALVRSYCDGKPLPRGVKSQDLITWAEERGIECPDPGGGSRK